MRLIAVLLISAQLIVPISPERNLSCNAGTSWIAGCSNSGTSLTISGEKTTNGTPGSRTSREHAGPRSPKSTLKTMRPAFRKCAQTETAIIACPDEPGPMTSEATNEEIPTVTIADLARFAPMPTVLTGEPDGVGVAGMPANFVARASTVAQSGSLFDYPLTVRFTPSGYDFHYGDGSRTTTITGGQSWESLGQAQFTPTSTSHVYRERGAYLARVNVRYTAEVDLGFGWIPIDGEVTATGTPREIRIYEARTALVAKTCEQNPSGPGC